MRVFLVGFTKLKYMPYLHFYLDRMKNQGHEIHILKWDRDKSIDSASPANTLVHSFKRELPDEQNKVKKVFPFLAYRRFVLRILRNTTYDRIVILHSLPGVLIYRYLERHYKGRYILDYRDLTYERYPPFSRVVTTLVNNSYATFVSSDAYRAVLPNCDKIYTSHNLLIDSLAFRNIGKRSCESPIVIAFWGLIRHYEINESIIKKLGNDQRFVLHYYGREQTTAYRLKALVEEEGYKNVFFHGEYLPADRYDFAKKTMIVHNLYDSDDPNIRLAMGNKYYDAIIFGLPQICTNGSYMGKRVSERNLGFACNPKDENFANALYSYYTSLDLPDFLSDCEHEISWVMHDLDKAKTIIESFLLEDMP